jgi:8-oxo-dGTP pyrophosphatase MutT (NUDIX family)
LASPVIHHVTTLDLPVDDWRWPFAENRRAEIDAHFARLRAAKPALWNGRVLLARQPRFDAGRFSARYFETDFASFLAWRDWGFPDPAVVNGFGMGALRGSDGGFVLGEMAAHTANAGRIYFASGTPDLSDVMDGRVDIAGSVAREVAEETGLTPTDYRADPDWHCVVSGSAIALIRILDVALPAAAVRARILGYLAAQTAPELSGIHIVRNHHDFTAAMPAFVTAFLAAQTAAA